MAGEAIGNAAATRTTVRMQSTDSGVFQRRHGDGTKQRAALCGSRSHLCSVRASASSWPRPVDLVRLGVVCVLCEVVMQSQAAVLLYL